MKSLFYRPDQGYHVSKAFSTVLSGTSAGLLASGHVSPSQGRNPQRPMLNLPNALEPSLSTNPIDSVVFFGSYLVHSEIEPSPQISLLVQCRRWYRQPSSTLNRPSVFLLLCSLANLLKSPDDPFPSASLCGRDAPGCRLLFCVFFARIANPSNCLF